MSSEVNGGAERSLPDALVVEIVQKITESVSRGDELPVGSCGCGECVERVTRAVLGALFDVCEVEETWIVTGQEPDEDTGWISYHDTLASANRVAVKHRGQVGERLTWSIDLPDSPAEVVSAVSGEDPDHER